MVPVWLNSRIRLAKAWSRGLRRGLEESEGQEGGIDRSKNDVLGNQTEMIEHYLLRSNKVNSTTLLPILLHRESSDTKNLFRGI